jgi:hypothetical protein
MKVRIMKECGYEESLYGLSLSFKDREITFKDWWTAERFKKLSSKATIQHKMDGGHNKFLESIQMWVEVEAPRGWWSEFDTYRLATKQSECYDDITEILTNSGWKLFKDVHMGDKVCTLNMTNKFIEYQYITNYISSFYQGDMIRFKGRSYDLKVTPNHNMVVKNRRGSSLRLLKAVNFTHNHAIPKGGIWAGNNINQICIPKIKNHLGSEDIFINTDVMLKFMGIFISEGYLYNYLKKSNYIIGVCQSKKSINYNEIDEFFKVFPFKVCKQSKGNDVKWLIHSKQLYRYLENQKGALHKYIPTWILNLPVDKLILFEKWIMMGDGCITNGHHIYISISKTLIDNMQELWLKIGSNSNIRVHQKMIGKRNIVWSISKHKTLYSYVLKNNILKEPYSGNIYCVEVPNHVIMVRRNNKITWSGNSTMHTIQKRQLLPYDFEDGTDSRQIDIFNEILKEETSNFTEKGLLIGDSLERVKWNLPEGFLQTRLVCVNYKTLRNMFIQRHRHRLKQWHTFIDSVIEQCEHPELLPEV